ncbi:O-antigen ligase family protein [Natrinema salaciae]|uniref:O-antigen ligase n=1 Tax=Natrinema salaciae TaxID=1186196 RepID=A0A1H8ZYU7_9EURY|nr:O-antigen ligase family protein [Natrinema salaciae]SEP68908.1 O-antigen ligase [Natrinema salaciae]
MAILVQTNTITFRSFASLVLPFFLFSAIILQHTAVSRGISYVVVFLVYSFSSLLYIHHHGWDIKVNKKHILLFFLLSDFILVSTILNLSSGTVVRYVSFLIFTGTSLFVIPKIIPLQYFLAAASRLSAVIVSIGFLPYFGLRIETAFIDLSLWSANIYWYPSLKPITSVFVNPNALGFLTLVGSIAALSELQKDKGRLQILFFTINVVGLAFSNYRTGWVAFVVTLSGYVVYRIGGRRLLMTATISGLSLLSLLLLMIFSVVPGPEALTEISLNHRRTRWIAGVYALQDKLWWGYGFGNVVDATQPYTPTETGNIHNSFIRAFVAFGFGGGFVYLLLYISTIFDGIRQCDRYDSIVIPMLLLSFLFVQLFNDLTFIGVSLHSATIALSMGYCIDRITEVEDPEIYST